MIPPLENIKFWAGAGLVALVLSSSHLLDGPSEIESAQATEASRLDALNDAQSAVRCTWVRQVGQSARSRPSETTTN